MCYELAALRCYLPMLEFFWRSGEAQTEEAMTNNPAAWLATLIDSIRQFKPVWIIVVPRCKE
jgi:hypothetical protein